MNKCLIVARCLLAALMVGLILPSCKKELPKPEKPKEEEKKEQPKKDNEKQDGEKPNPPKDDNEGDKPTPPKDDEGNKPNPPKDDNEGDKPTPPTPPTPPAPPTPPEPPTPPTPPATDPTMVDEEPGLRNVVLLNFTGQRCTYCYRNGQSIREKAKEIGEQYIPVFLHDSYSYSPDLYLREAAKYSAPLNVKGYPSIRFNNTPVENRPLNEMLKEKDLYKAEIDLKHNGREITLEVLTRVYSSQKSLHKTPLNLLVWVVEDDLKFRQSSPMGNIEGYVHDFVFRGSLNGTWGQQIELGEKATIKHTLGAVVKNPENASIVVFVMERRSHRFLDATKIPLAKK